MSENQKKIWITGASSGIGRALAEKFATEGWKVAASARRKEILEDIKLISINEIYSSSDPGKKLHSVLSGPYANRSAANNSKEVITKKGFEPRLRTLCKEK